METLKFLLFSLVSLGWRGAKARGEDPGQEDPDIASVLSERARESSSHRKISSEQKNYLLEEFFKALPQRQTTSYTPTHISHPCITPRLFLF